MDGLLELVKMYDLEEDIAPSEIRNKVAGSDGMGLANRCFQTYGTFNIKGIIERQRNWEKWETIAFRRFPSLLPGETILAREVRQRLTGLKKAGYDIQSGYSRLKKKEAWAYFRGIKKDIRTHLNNPVLG